MLPAIYEEYVKKRTDECIYNRGYLRRSENLLRVVSTSRSELYTIDNVRKANRNAI